GRLPPALGLLREEDRGFSQDLALLTQDPVIPPQTVELSPLVTIKPGPGAASDVRAFHPLPERVAAHAQLVSYLLQRPPALAEQPYRLDLELKRVGRISGSSLHGQSFPSNLAQAGICPPKRGNSKAGVPPVVVVVLDVAADSFPGDVQVVVGVQVDVLVLQAPPESLDEDVVPPTALAVHADPDVPGLQHA